MMRYKVTHTTTYSYSDSVPVCQNEVYLTPRDLSHQTCAYNRLLIKPVPATLDRRIDYFGNHVMSFAVQEAHAKLSVTAVRSWSQLSKSGEFAVSIRAIRAL